MESLRPRSWTKGRGRRHPRHLHGLVSVGMIGGVPMLDLNYEEDSKAGTDMNVVATDKGRFVELQGTAESQSFSEEEMHAMVALARAGIGQLVTKQREVLTPNLTRVDTVARERLNKKFR